MYKQRFFDELGQRACKMGFQMFSKGTTIERSELMAKGIRG